jgi:hypothetical protein
MMIRCGNRILFKKQFNLCSRNEQLTTISLPSIKLKHSDHTNNVDTFEIFGILGLEPVLDRGDPERSGTKIVVCGEKQDWSSMVSRVL